MVGKIRRNGGVIQKGNHLRSRSSYYILKKDHEEKSMNLTQKGPGTCIKKVHFYFTLISILSSVAILQYKKMLLAKFLFDLI